MTVQVNLKLSRPDFDLEADFDAPGTGITVIQGASGSGKTTLLRSIAGLETDARGKVSVNNHIWQDETGSLAVNLRSVGYVFQESRIFPHLSVRDNLLYGAKRSKSDVNSPDFDEVVALLGVGNFLTRSPFGLSGGEKQRVAIARALLSNPVMLLMDEPLVSLDHKSKQDILPYIENLRDELSIPILYVSHSADELARLADYLLIMAKGRITAKGKAMTLLSDPDSPLARQEDAFSLLNGKVIDHDDRHHLTQVSLGSHTLRLPKISLSPGQEVRLRIYARDVSLCLDSPSQSSILNIIPATVSSFSDPNLGQLLVKLEIDGNTLFARISSLSREQLALSPGTKIFVQIKAIAVMR